MGATGSGKSTVGDFFSRGWFEWHLTDFSVYQLGKRFRPRRWEWSQVLHRCRRTLAKLRAIRSPYHLNRYPRIRWYYAFRYRYSNFHICISVYSVCPCFLNIRYYHWIMSLFVLAMRQDGNSAVSYTCIVFPISVCLGSTEETFRCSGSFAGMILSRTSSS